MRGKVIKTSAKNGVFVQIDKNNQVCDLFVYDKSLPKENRVRQRIRGSLFDTFKGRPLYTAWGDLVTTITKEENLR